MKRALRYVLLACGCLALALGVAGIFLPILPTTPFVLLAAACFLRSSERLHRFVSEHPTLGPPIQDYLAGRGLTKRTKALAITMLWGSLLASAYLCLTSNLLRGALILVACLVSLYLLRLPTRSPAAPRP